MINAAVILAVEALGFTFTCKEFKGMDTMRYNVTIKYNGKRVAMGINDGNGGESMVEAYDKSWKDLCKQIEAIFAAQPPVIIEYGDGEGKNFESKYDWDFFFEELIIVTDLRKKVASGKTVFIFDNGVQTEQYVFNHPPTPQLLAKCLADPKLKGFKEFRQLMGMSMPTDAEIDAIMRKEAEKEAKKGKTLGVRDGLMVVFNCAPALSNMIKLREKHPTVRFFAN